MVDLLSPRARAAADHVTAIETELTQLRADVAPALERIAILERSLDALELAALPGQLPLLDAGPTVAAPKPRPFRLTAKGEELLRAADANESRTVIVPRSVATRGATIAAEHLVGLAPPLLTSAGTQSTGARLYKLTPDGEAVARALPARVAP